MQHESGGRSGKTVTRTAILHLAHMNGTGGINLRQLAGSRANRAEADRINVSFSIDDTHVSVTFDPADLPHHPQRRRPVVPLEVATSASTSMPTRSASLLPRTPKTVFGC
ncbi:hypothetical protein ACI2KT_36495 [Ensifer adhaerens]|uniref:hypothetical protein n=1 Tax=Ensifer adhaerens TaxID=106592 RepID=UPI00384C9FB7